MKAFPAAFVIILFALAGCSSGVVPAGPGVWMISRNGTAVGTGARQKAALYREADEWCKARGLVMIPIEENATDGLAGYTLASAELKFRAVKPEDVARVTPRRDHNGATAADYDQLAKQYEAEGRTEMAELARKRADALR
jgi:hypothetical protein